MRKISAERVSNLLKVLIYVLVGVLVVSRGVILFPDSYTFLDMAINHSITYCLFLKVFTFLFNDHYEIPLLISQYVFIIYGIIFIIKRLLEIFDINWFGKIVLQILLLAPCIYLHLLGSAILSEAIAYPLFLLFFGFSLKMFVNESFEDIFKIFLLLVALVLTRGQFIALVPALAMIVTYTLIKNKASLKSWYVLIVLIIVPLTASLAEKIYNKINYDHFVGNTMNYVHLISSPFYLSNPNDIYVFNQENQKSYFNLIYRNLENRQLLYNQIDLNESDNYQFYHQNFSNICNKGVYKLGLEFFENKGFDYYEQHIQLNKLCKSMLIPLIKQNWESWIYLYIKNVKNSFGSFKQLLLFLLLLVYGLIYLDTKNNKFFKFLVMGIIFMFANNCLVAIPIHTIKRYIFYFDWLIFAVFIILIKEKLRKRIAYEC